MDFTQQQELQWADNLPTETFGVAELSAALEAIPRSGLVSWRYRRAWQRAAQERLGTSPETLENFLQTRSEQAQAMQELRSQMTSQPSVQNDTVWWRRS